MNNILSDSDRHLCARAAMAARELSWAPYSKFRVGAAILMGDGSVVVGGNQENASSPLCLCAERVALAVASALKSGVAVEVIAVAGIDTVRAVTPCGACRQVLMEVQRRQQVPIRVVACGDDECLSTTVNELLPLAFEL